MDQDLALAVQAPDPELVTPLGDDPPFPVRSDTHSVVAAAHGVHRGGQSGKNPHGIMGPRPKPSSAVKDAYCLMDKYRIRFRLAVKSRVENVCS